MAGSQGRGWFSREIHSEKRGKSIDSPGEQGRKLNSDMSASLGLGGGAKISESHHERGKVLREDFSWRKNSCPQREVYVRHGARNDKRIPSSCCSARGRERRVKTLPKGKRAEFWNKEGKKACTTSTTLWKETGYFPGYCGRSITGEEKEGLVKAAA